MIIPIGDRLLVKKGITDEYYDKEKRIQKPQTFQDEARFGTVIAIGDDVKKTYLKDKKIMFGKYAGAEIEDGGEKYLLVREEEVFGYYE